MSDPTQQVPEPDNPQATQPVTPQDTTTGGATQADIDRIISERLKRDRQVQEEKRKERFGGLSDDEMLALIEKQRKADEAALSETQKLQAQIEAANRKAQEAENKYQEMQARVLNEQRRNVFESAITASGGTNAKRLYMLVQAEKGTEFTALFGDDATVDDGKLKAFVKQVQADFPEYFGNSGAGSPSNSNGVAPNSQNNDELAKQLKKKFGKL